MSEETVKDHYRQKKRLKLSLNDQLEDFYEGSKINNLRDECAYFFHTKRLNPEELRMSQKDFETFILKRTYDLDGKIVPRYRPSWLYIRKVENPIKNKKESLFFEDGTLALENPFEKMDNNEYILYNCFRITLKITPELVLSLTSEQLDVWIENLNPFMYIDLWRSSRTRCDVEIPKSKSTKVIGLSTTNNHPKQGRNPDRVRLQKISKLYQIRKTSIWTPCVNQLRFIEFFRPFSVQGWP